MSHSKYYVYVYLREKQSRTLEAGVIGSVSYVGKGCDDRAYRKHINVGKPTDKKNIVIVADNLSEDDAYSLEIELIRFYGRINNGTGILRNRTDGGPGGTGTTWNP